MNALKSLETRLRGWIPKDMNLPTRQQMAPPKANGHKLKMWGSMFVTLAIVLGIQGVLSPAFAPERSWSLYFTATGIIIGVAFIVLLVRLKQTRTVRGLKVGPDSESQIRGWLPKEPSQNNYHSINSAPQSKAELDKKAFKAAQIANPVMVGVFLGTNFLFIHPAYDSLEVSILQWSIFVPTVIIVNVLIYRHYKQRLLPKGWF
jgi:protein-S-isoprenylcysteine O-methyltransferase Ste14